MMNVLRRYFREIRGYPGDVLNGRLVICKVAPPPPLAPQPQWSQKTKKYFTRVMDWSELQTFHIQQVFEQIYL